MRFETCQALGHAVNLAIGRVCPAPPQKQAPDNSKPALANLIVKTCLLKLSKAIYFTIVGGTPFDKGQALGPTVNLRIKCAS